jgi:hypothetical protein
MRFLGSGFFYESTSPQSPKIKLGSFRIFSKIHGDIHKSRFTTGINDTSGKFCIFVPTNVECRRENMQIDGKIAGAEELPICSQLSHQPAPVTS